MRNANFLTLLLGLVSVGLLIPAHSIAESRYRGLGTGLEVGAPYKDVVVEYNISARAKEAGFGEKAAKIKAEPLFRAAGINENPANRANTLHVAVDVVGRAFLVQVFFSRVVNYRANVDDEYVMVVPTWRTTRFGTYAADTGYISSAVGIAVEDFLSEYLKANAPPGKKAQ